MLLKFPTIHIGIISFIALYPVSNYAQSVITGEQAFNECRACHTLEPNVHSVGPSLAGVINRPIGSITSYRYSKALKNANGNWDAATLNKFLENPQALFPGNRMPYSGNSNAAERSAIIDYLTTFKP